jgi:hypothetical protein
MTQEPLAHVDRVGALWARGSQQGAQQVRASKAAPGAREPASRLEPGGQSVRGALPVTYSLLSGI